MLSLPWEDLRELFPVNAKFLVCAGKYIHRDQLVFDLRDVANMAGDLEPTSDVLSVP